MISPCIDCGGERRGKQYIKGRRRCRDCHNAHKRVAEKEANRKYKERVRSTPEGRERPKGIHEKWRYRLSPEDRNAILEAQGGKCAICGTTDPQGRGWVVDHDHTCCPGIQTCGGCNRGILCTKCNFLLGHANDDIDILTSAITYLMTHSSRRLPI